MTLKKIFPIRKSSNHNGVRCRCDANHRDENFPTYSNIELNCNSFHNGMLPWPTSQSVTDKDMNEQASWSQTNRNAPVQYCLKDKKQRHVYHTIEIANSTTKIDGEQVIKKTKPPIPYKPHYLQAKYLTQPMPLVPPRMKNTEAVIQRRQLTEEYFENIIRNVDEEQAVHSLKCRENQPDCQHSTTVDEYFLNNMSCSSTDSTYKQSSHQNLTSNLKLLKLCGWYWGDMTWKEAELMLEQRPGEVGKNTVKCSITSTILTNHILQFLILIKWPFQNVLLAQRLYIKS